MQSEGTGATRTGVANAKSLGTVTMTSVAAAPNSVPLADRTPHGVIGGVPSIPPRSTSMSIKVPGVHPAVE
jgi:hypothetical protein